MTRTMKGGFNYKKPKGRQKPMKYFFVMDTKGKRHIVVAQELSNVSEIVKDSKLEVDYAYELEPDTFKDQGFLFSDK